MNTTINQILRDAEARLTASDSPRLDAELLLGHCLGKPRAYLLAHADDALTASHLESFNAFLRRRLQGEPIAYLTGTREFWDIELQVNPAVLVPRPETELLVETALELFAGQDAIRLADLGTGSGAIALALANSKPHWQVDAVDISEQALATAMANAHRLGIRNVQFHRASWCDPLEPHSYDLIIANPPYVAPGDGHLQRGDLRFEPEIALTAAENGLAALYTIADQARAALKDNAWLLLEHGSNQYPPLTQRLVDLGYTAVTGRDDLAGQPRMIQCQWQPASATGDSHLNT